ncbi:MAG: TonB-dependent receptor [Deltaproteobacteria bacterium]|nr:TonB-dependent receptor [Deltaproteobacteria bacterium]
MHEPDASAGEPPASAAALLPVNFKGRVREAGNRKPVVSAVIQLSGRPVAETNGDGEFEVRGAPPGAFVVRISAASYDPYEVEETLRPGEALEVNYYLVRRAQSPFETVVRSRAERQEVAKVELQRQEVSKIPGTFGDPVRVIENLPGMGRTPGGLGGALLVRGDRPSATAVYMDGVAIPQLYHFAGLTSVVNAEFLEKIDFYPGGFGARYGSATAGVVDVTTRDVRCDLWRAAAKADLVDAAAYTCTPAAEWHVAAAGRRSYIDALLPLVIERVVKNDEGQGSATLSPRYWDYQAKASRVVGVHAIDIFAFGSDDRLRLILAGSAENINANFGGHLMFHRLVARDRFRINDKLTLTSTVAPGYTANSAAYTAEEISFAAGVQLNVWSADWREDLSYELDDGLTINAGLDHRLGTAIFRMDNPAPTELRYFPTRTFDYTRIQKYRADMSAFNQGYWVEVVAEPVPGVKLVPGLRLDRWDFFHTQDWSLLPRATARVEVVAGTTLKAAYGLYEKLPEPGFLLDTIGNPGLDPERAHHFVLGVEETITPVVSLDVQGFYNLRSHIPTPSAKVTYEDGRAIFEVWSSTGAGRAYGLEVLLRHLATADGAFYGWLSYTLSRSLQEDNNVDTTQAIQGGGGGGRPAADSPATEHLSPFDQTHILTVVAQWVLPCGFEAGFRFRLVSGNPYTPLDRGAVRYDADSDSYALDLSGVERNSARMPTFNQLDVRIDRTWVFDLFKLTCYLELINAYYAKNVEQYSYDFRFREKTPITLLPILPVLGVKGEF